MSILTINLQEKMLAANRKVLSADQSVLDNQAALNLQIEKLQVNAESQYKTDLAKELGFDYKVAEASAIVKRDNSLSHLPQDRIFTKDAIRDICVTYGLRFLLTKYYKGMLDEGIGAAVEDFKKINKGALGECYIVAPTASFNLSPRSKDPLLFVKLAEDRYYLLHKWGGDLSVFARVKNWAWGVYITIAFFAILNLTLPAFLYRNHVSNNLFGASFVIGVFLSLLFTMIYTLLLDNAIVPPINGLFGRVHKDNWQSKFSN